jgi:DNA-binding NtrC family response regulator
MEDLPFLLRQLSGRSGTAKSVASAATWAALEAYLWPGNVRELGTVLSEAAQRSSGQEIELSDLPAQVRSGATRAVEANHRLFFKDAKDQLLAQFERSYLSEVLSDCDGNLSHAARASGLHRRSVSRLAKKYQLQTRAPKGR